MQSTRREFLGLGGSFLLVPPKLSWAAAEQERPSASPVANPELPWREPGQFKDPEYLRTAKLRYSAAGREIVGRNRTCFNNRPLYCEPPVNCVVLAGDRPFLRVLAEPYILGCFSAALLRGGEGRWFHEYSEVETRYRCGKMTWHLQDNALSGVSIVLTAVPLHGAAGVAVRLEAQGLLAGDKLLWAFGGAVHEKDTRGKWDPIMRGNPNLYRTGDPRKELANLGMLPAKCRANRVVLNGQEFRLIAEEGATRAAVGKCDRPGRLRVADASAYSSPQSLSESTAGELPMVVGMLELQPNPESKADTLFWVVEAPDAESGPTWSQDGAQGSAAAAFQAGVNYLKSVERVEIETPEPRLNAAVASVCHPIDAACDRNPYVYRHGCMSFYIRFLGWRVLCGATALGWHERIRGEAAYYAPFQVQDSVGHEVAYSDPEHGYTIEGHASRFWGRGRLAPNDTHEYDTQTEFIDQAIRDWRWTGDPEMEKILRPMLELHLEWAQDCFDPDDDGLYESYANTLPTDSVWYNGGGSVEESAYVYYAHLAAADMATRAGDTAAATRHSERAQKIHRALFEVLWQDELGHFGAYVEQGGHRRVHTDAWVLSQFLPVDAGMTTPEQALQALYSTEWWLERTHLPYGGELCQSSNWVPWKWSVRDTFGGDACALALAYFQTGLGDLGWDLLLGATLESAYGGAVPGGLSHIGAGTDFSDNCHMFARTVVEGLFGFEPDRPNNRVRFRPAFPAAWDKASIRTPDFSFEYRQEGALDHYRFTLTQKADVECVLPVRANKITRVTWNGQEIPWAAEPGFGLTQVRLHLQDEDSGSIAIELVERVAAAPAIPLEGQAGEEARLAVPQGRLLRWRDYHHVLEEPRIENEAIHGRLTRKPGFHIVLGEVKVGDLPQFQVFKVHVRDPALEAQQASHLLYAPPERAQWKLLDLAPHYNGDVRTIFQQSYLSPRPKTCSLRLNANGYAPWTFYYWNEKPPAIGLENLPALTDAAGRIVTPQKIPFDRFDQARNIAFTSLWDNWPASVTVPVSEEAEACWLLVCGSTFPNQTRIANAEVTFRYADGAVERLEIVPPLNFWMLSTWGGEDYNYVTDGFCLPKRPPNTVQLGSNCRAVVLSWKLRRGVRLNEIVFETLSQDVVIGLMGVTLMNPLSR